MDDKLVWLSDVQNTILSYGIGWGDAKVKGVLASIPAVDAVEVVRCADCKYCDDVGIDEDGYPFMKCLHGRSYGVTGINDYCSWGQRREEEHNAKDD